MANLQGKPSLQHILERLQIVESLDGIVVATTMNAEDDVIAQCGEELGLAVFRGSAEDVLARTLGAARAVGARSIVTVTGDCPLTDPAVVTRVVAEYQAHQPDYASNRLQGYVFPIGLDVEVFPVFRLAELDRDATATRDREHVTLAFYENPDRYDLLEVRPLDPRQERPDLRLTLDTEDDYALISAIYEALYPLDPRFGLDAVLDLLEKRPDLEDLNRHIQQKAP